MLRSETLFGKRENTTPNSALTTASGIVPPGTGMNKAPAQVTSPIGSNAVKNDPVPSSVSSNVNEGGSKLVVGANIKLKGDISNCDILAVEGGWVEATIDARMIQISERGAFKGSAEVDIAEIHGEYDGNLTVRQKLVIYSTGKVSGTVRYGKLVIEEGGQLAGDIQAGAASVSKGLAVAKAG